MIKGILVVLALAILGGWAGYEVAEWWVDKKTPNAGPEEIMSLGAGLVLGAIAGLGLGLGISYALGRKETD